MAASRADCHTAGWRQNGIDQSGRPILYLRAAAAKHFGAASSAIAASGMPANSVAVAMFDVRARPVGKTANLPRSNAPFEEGKQ